MALPVLAYSDAVAIVGGAASLTVGPILEDDVILFFLATAAGPGAVNGTLAFTPDLSADLLAIEISMPTLAVQPYDISVVALRDVTTAFFIASATADIAGSSPLAVAVTGWPDGIAVMQIWRNVTPASPIGTVPMLKGFGVAHVALPTGAAIEPIPQVFNGPGNNRAFGWPFIQYLFRLGTPGVVTPPVPDAFFPLPWTVVEDLAANGLHAAVLQYSVLKSESSFNSQAIEANPAATWSATSNTKTSWMAALMPLPQATPVTLGCSPDSVD